MKFLQDIPALADGAVLGALQARYGLAGTLKRIAGERDQNFLLREESGSGWVVKVVNPNEEPGSVQCQLEALLHVQRTDAGVPVPRVRLSRDGDSSIRVEGSDGQPHLLYVVSFIEGRVAEGVAWNAPLLQDVGATIARLCRAMRGFHHPALQGRHLPWDLRDVQGLAAHLDTVADAAERAVLARVIAQSPARALPLLAQMPSQSLHADAHPSNIVVGPDDRVAGIIDFGDMLYGPRALEIAGSIADFLEVSGWSAEVPASILAGYRRISPLSEPELAALYDLVLMRLATTRLILGWTRDNAQGGQYADTDDATLAAIVHTIGELHALGPGRFADGLGAGDLESGAASSPLLARRRRVMGARPYVFYDPPLHLVRGEGVWLFDTQGRRYLDGYNNVPVVGHCHPAVVEAVHAQMQRLCTHTRYLGEEVVAYAERLASSLGDGLRVCTFVNSGSEANDVAWRMARAWTRATGALTQEFAYHGVTEAVDALSPSSRGARAAPAHVRELCAPDPYRGSHRAGTAQLGMLYAQDADRAIASLGQAGMRPAAVIVDSAFMANGMLEPLPGYLAGVFERVRAAGGLCIADEVQSGFGRMGTHFWGFRHHGVVPDIVTIGKPAGNGHPLGAVITRPEIHECLVDESPFFSTFGGNNVSAVAGLAVLDAMEREGLVARAAVVGARLKDALRLLAERHRIIGDVRGTGLALGVELVSDRSTRAPATVVMARALNLIRDEGLLVGNDGPHGNVIKIRPSLAFDVEHVDIAVGALDRALARL